ncbi:contractile injection system protein, VgrG/Pvc8 family [Paenibacillus durus]|uniref:Gp5/Type VI secretion system Vgr protein OB-fold domain-containing protein n=1 Tax=Paenibacillus durus ATCC 35681 TaxID=1333534 RepID=A0A0F7FAU6_PAEDU|nr:contractile injection system protein, VgrG/Pvc8 family [Paenibacillus durus]AKG35288.1 hypothetical protein VK70_12470 [Paenibacillus durus ATCC 35681]
MGYPIISYNNTNLQIINPKIKIIQKLNDHAKLRITGILSGDTDEKYINQMNVNAKLTVSFQNDNGQKVILFKGLVSNIRIRYVANVAHLFAEAKSFTSKMDQTPHSRSFQNTKMKYQTILKLIMEQYPQSDLISQLKEQTLGSFTVQYKETDWEFLKRMASRFGWGLAPNPVGDHVQFYFGLPDGAQRGELQEFNYSMTRTTNRSNASILFYKVQTTGTNEAALNIGDEVKFNGLLLKVLQSVAAIRHGSLWHEYLLATDDGMKQDLILNEQIRGMTLKSKVIGLEQDHVKVFFYEMDKVKPAVPDTCAFPYATFYTSEGNTGWYCMPELFDFVDIYFPTHEEKDAIVTHSIRRRSKGGDLIKDPSVKIFMTKYRKAVIFEKNEILITGNDDEVVIRLLDDHGIELRSKKDIRVKADGNLDLRAGNTVQITAKNAIGLKCKTSVLEMDGNIKLSGASINMH